MNKVTPYIGTTGSSDREQKRSEEYSYRESIGLKKVQGHQGRLGEQEYLLNLKSDNSGEVVGESGGIIFPAEEGRREKVLGFCRLLA